LVVTGLSMAIGTALYLVVAIEPMRSTDWARVSTNSWFLMTASAVFALAFAYMVWYTGVQRIGSARTSVYSNLTPVVAMSIGVVLLGERVTWWQVFGAALILSGLAISRRPAGRAVRSSSPRSTVDTDVASHHVEDRPSAPSPPAPDRSSKQ
jgi:drug/metabolite transporter (DMT)-like permease